VRRFIVNVDCYRTETRAARLNHEQEGAAVIRQGGRRK